MSGEQTYAAGADEQPQDDQNDAKHDLSPYDSDDPCDHEQDREDPQEEVHGEVVPASPLTRPRAPHMLRG